MSCKKHPRYDGKSPPELSCNVCCKRFVDKVKEGDKVRTQLTEVLIYVQSDNFEGFCTKPYYKELTLQMSSGDHGSHKINEFGDVDLQSWQANEPVYSDLTDTSYASSLVKDFVVKQPKKLPSNVVSIFRHKKAENSQQTDTTDRLARTRASLEKINELVIKARQDKVKADRKSSNAQVIKELKNGKNNKGAV